MTFPDITPELKAAMPQLRGRLLANQSLAELTWFRVGGPAQVLFTPSDEDDLAYFLAHLPNELPVYVVGVGSNLIVRDGGMPGVVIRLSPRGFGETSADGKFTFEPQSICLGACDLAPMASVDGTYVGPLTVEDVPRLLDDARAGRAVLAEKQLAPRLVADPQANSREFPPHPAQEPEPR